VVLFSKENEDNNFFKIKPTNFCVPQE